MLATNTFMQIIKNNADSSTRRIDCNSNIQKRFHALSIFNLKDMK